MSLSHRDSRIDNVLGIPRFHRQKGRVNDFSRFLRPVPIALALGLAGLGAAVIAQIEGGDRGVAPIDSSSDFEVPVLAGKLIF